MNVHGHHWRALALGVGGALSACAGGELAREDAGLAGYVSTPNGDAAVIGPGPRPDAFTGRDAGPTQGDAGPAGGDAGLGGAQPRPDGSARARMPAR